jgi:hypothetical protein
MFGTVALAAAIATGTAIGALRGDSDAAGPDAAGVTTMTGHGSAILPYETGTDWVSYADHVIAARVESDAELPAPEDIERGEGYIGRRVVLRVEDKLWSRSGAPVAVPDTLELDVAGWVLHDGQRRDFVLEGGPRVEVGHSYIFPFAWLGEEGWAPLSTAAVLPYDEGVIGRGENHGADADEGTALFDEASGRSGPELANLLAATEPYPETAAFAHLDPRKRWEMAQGGEN